MRMTPISRGRISHPIISEIGWLLRALVSRLDDPIQVKEAENAFANYVKRKHCTVFPFARTAIWATLRSLNLPMGSRVLLPPLTIKPILDVVIHLGMTPVFVDVDPETACFEETRLMESLKQNPKVAILTYLFGLVPNVGQIVKTLKEQDVYIIEDFSQCLNGEFNGKRIGTFGDVSIYSASSVKTLDTFGGGFAVTDNEVTAHALTRIQASLDKPVRFDLLKSVMRNLFRNIASNRIVFSLITFRLLNLLSRFSTNSLGRFTGRRSTEPLEQLPDAWFRKYTSLQARVAMSEIPRVLRKDQMRIGRIQKIVSSVKNVARPTGDFGQRHVYWQFIIYVNDFNSARQHFLGSRIDCATTSLVLLTDLPKYPGQVDTPNAKRIFELGVYLPCYHQLRDAEATRIAESLNALNSSS